MSDETTQLSDQELEALTAPDAPETDAPKADAAAVDAPAVDADAADVDADAGKSGIFQDGNVAPKDAETVADAGVVAPDAETAPVADETPAIEAAPVAADDVSDDDAKAPLTEGPFETGDVAATGPSEPAEAPLEGEHVTVGAEHTAGALGDVLSGNADKADDASAEDAEAPVADAPAADAPMPAIAEQPSVEDANAAKPLSAEATDETRPAVDAMPDDAQQHMASFTVPTDDHPESGPGQLPNKNELPGTPDDATGISETLPGYVANPEDFVADDSDESEGDDDVDAGDDEDGLYADAKVEHGPLADLMGDGVDHLKDAAESAFLAQQALLRLPIELLELEHKEMLSRFRSVLAEVVFAADVLFSRR